ncbi:MAG: hypothetical protein KKD44_28100 [Proteobacteria bacterium]|nr:hypothetical protein [Pseudomonadota bacterium]
MTEENKPNVEDVKKQIEEIRTLLTLSDDELKAMLIKEIEDMFSDPEKIKEMRAGYDFSIKQLEGATMMLEGLQKMADGMGQSMNISESISKAVNFETKPKK